MVPEPPARGAASGRPASPPPSPGRPIGLHGLSRDVPQVRVSGRGAVRRSLARLNASTGEGLLTLDEFVERGPGRRSRAHSS